MENTEIITSSPNNAALLENVLVNGDLSRLTPQQRLDYYRQVCESMGLNPLSRPFDYINLNGKLTLYAKKDATDQLRKINGVSIDDIQQDFSGDLFIVTVKGSDRTGRRDVEMGVVAKNDMRGNIGNAMMKAVTKAKRRLTLSLCGLGWLDETEVETIPDARPVIVDSSTGEIVQDNAQRTAAAANAPKPSSNTPAQQNPQEAQETPFNEDEFLTRFTGVKEFALTPMSAANAEKVQDSDGIPYGMIPTKDLRFRLNALIGSLKRNHLTDDQRQDRLFKLGVINALLLDRKEHPEKRSKPQA